MKLSNPLIDQVRRTEYGKPINFKPIPELSYDKTSFNGFSDADIIGDQQPHRVHFQCHKKRYQLIGPWFNGDMTERSERTSSIAKLEHQGFTEQSTGAHIGKLGRYRVIEIGCPYRLLLKIRGNIDNLITASQRAEYQNHIITASLNNPVSSSCTYQVAWCSTKITHFSIPYSPNTSEFALKISSHEVSSVLTSKMLMDLSAQYCLVASLAFPKKIAVLAEV
ncbi:hypothetical protein DSECCO2_621890 [anaerobic digester metagenome]